VPIRQTLLEAAGCGGHSGGDDDDREERGPEPDGDDRGRKAEQALVEDEPAVAADQLRHDERRQEGRREHLHDSGERRRQAAPPEHDRAEPLEDDGAGADDRDD
jgi:hypothetical protein